MLHPQFFWNQQHLFPCHCPSYLASMTRQLLTPVSYILENQVMLFCSVVAILIITQLATFSGNPSDGYEYQSRSNPSDVDMTKLFKRISVDELCDD